MCRFETGSLNAAKLPRSNCMCTNIYKLKIEVLQHIKSIMSYLLKYSNMKRTVTILFLLAFWVVQTMAQVRPTVAVLGDSYSTFEGFIPEGNAIWYFNPAHKDQTDVERVEQTWWWQVIKEGGYKMGMINAYSGSTVCNTGYGDADFSDRSFVTRDRNLGNPDIILICGATNDSWAGVKMGEYQYNDWRRADLYYFRPAMAKLLSDIRQYYPNVDVYFILNSELKDDINKSVDEVCRHYDVPVIKLKDIDKKNGHPSVKGMKSFASQVLKAIKK